MLTTTRLIALALLPLLVLALPVAAAPAERGPQIFLRRGAFDPLHARPPLPAALQATPDAPLQLVQFEREPTDATRLALAEAGWRALAYLPDQALLVRRVSATSAAPGLPGVRWAGPLQPGDKLAPDLDALAQSPGAELIDLRVLLAPDANPRAFADALAAAGGEVQGQAAGLQGTQLRVRLPALRLLGLLRDPAVLWAERALMPQLQNDRARTIVGVTRVRQQLGWLTGAGQAVAVTDTGLDVQAQVLAGANPDFAAGRIAAAFTPAQMDPSDPSCASTTDWGDRYGHGTHVAGSVLGAGARSPAGPSLAGMAPGARLVLQNVSLGSGDLGCLRDDSSFLAKAYAAGARVQNASWGGATGGSQQAPEFGGYDLFASGVDEFLWSHPSHLLVVAAGNDGSDGYASAFDGVVDPDSINSPGTAKNVLTVGASESYRPPSAGCGASPPENICWWGYGFGAPPLEGDFISDNAGGIAAWSSRGPTDDGRIKPELVAPGTNIVSAASHDPNAYYPYGKVGADYAYDSGTSMAAPIVSGLAALVRQWLANARALPDPSAALVKALLLNGAADLGAGQYGAGAAREIPSAMPNNVAGWGRADLAGAIDAADAQTVWFADGRAAPAAGSAASYTLLADAGAPLRITLAWTDYPASVLAGRALVNDLDLEVRGPNGTLWRGNARAQLASSCRDTAGADRCNTVEGVIIGAPLAGQYTVVVRSARMQAAGQRYALAARAAWVGDTPAVPKLALGDVRGPVVPLSWGAAPLATRYMVEQSDDASFAQITNTIATSAAEAEVLAQPGQHWYRVRACVGGLCGQPSAAVRAQVGQAPWRFFLTGFLA